MGLRVIAVTGLTLALVLAGCGESPAVKHPQPVTPSEWKSVIRDSYDGRIDYPHRCAAVREAIRHLPVDPPIASTVLYDLRAYERTVCGLRVLYGPSARSSRHF
jgi:hypothetical protein